MHRRRLCLRVLFQRCDLQEVRNGPLQPTVGQQVLCLVPGSCRMSLLLAASSCADSTALKNSVVRTGSPHAPYSNAPAALGPSCQRCIASPNST